VRDNNNVPTDLRKFVEFGGMACPVSNQERSNQVWIQIDNWEQYERWIDSKAIATVQRRNCDIIVVGTNQKLAEINCDTPDAAKEKMAAIMKIIALAPDGYFSEMGSLTLTPDQEEKLRIADFAIEMSEGWSFTKFWSEHPKLFQMVKNYIDRRDKDAATS
jgi:hypothetical protein